MDARPLRRLVLGAALAAAVVITSSCRRDDEDAGSRSTDPVGTSTPTGSEAPTETSGADDTTVPPTPPPTPPPTFETVTTAVVGAAVGGSAGNIGEEATESFSEAVRNADGTCSGWDGPGGTWTQGLVSGAPVVFLARDNDTQLGTGVIGTSRWEDVGTDREQWNCIFPFEGEIEGEPESFRIQVADLPPWVVVRNAADPSQWVTSIDTRVRIDPFGECVEPGAGLDVVSSWQSVGTYWSRGVPQLCGAGLAIADVERPCRPNGIASEHIVVVTRADDPAVVLEDASGLLVDPATLSPGTEVVVHVATGRPCG